jgi:hypothetical protein
MEPHCQILTISRRLRYQVLDSLVYSTLRYRCAAYTHNGTCERHHK